MEENNICIKYLGTNWQIFIETDDNIECYEAVCRHFALCPSFLLFKRLSGSVRHQRRPEDLHRSYSIEPLVANDLLHKHADAHIAVTKLSNWRQRPQ